MHLFEELWGLPAVGLSLQVELPKLLSPALNRLCDAVADDDPDPELLDVSRFNYEWMTRMGVYRLSGTVRSTRAFAGGERCR